jgi:putative addiction module antidote
MITTVKVIQAGDSLGIELSQELLTCLAASPGDTLTVTPTPGGFQLSSVGHEDACQLALANQIMEVDADVLRKLAE